MAEPTVIEPRPNGPLMVSGEVTLTNSRGEIIATEAKFWLCRCGGSANKPFCDGTHKRKGFSSERETKDAGQTKDHVGKAITIHDNRSVCAHVGHCTDHAPDVFSTKSEPWIDADGGVTDRTIAAIRMCPSGALSYSVDGVRQQIVGRAPAIQITKDGPYAVVGGPALLGDAAPFNAEHYALCRCGASKNKPFCDGSHYKAGFEDQKN